MAGATAKTNPKKAADAVTVPDVATRVDPEAARKRLASMGRNDLCPCGSGKKYKKCCLQSDQAATYVPPVAPTADDHVAAGWRLFEQSRPKAAEKEFRVALTLAPGLPQARVGVGLANLSANETEAAEKELSALVKDGEELFSRLRSEKVTDAFSRAESQPYLRAAHALGCLHFDKDRFEAAREALVPVADLDSGPVGTEARLILGKTMIKLGKAAEAVPILTEAGKAEAAGGRAHMGLALVKFMGGDKAGATEALEAALAKNSFLGKAVLGQIRREVASPLGAAPGSPEEAVIYAQTYGDIWDDGAREFLMSALADRAGRTK